MSTIKIEAQQGGGSGSEVTKRYVDYHDAATLNEAIDYASESTENLRNSLASVAFTGEYSDLENEPEEFSPDDWALLWGDD